jgi:hypothetical protein
MIKIIISNLKKSLHNNADTDTHPQIRYSVNVGPWVFMARTKQTARRSASGTGKAPRGQLASKVNGSTLMSVLDYCIGLYIPLSFRILNHASSRRHYRVVVGRTEVRWAHHRFNKEAPPLQTRSCGTARSPPIPEDNRLANPQAPLPAFGDYNVKAKLYTHTH